MDSFEKIGDKMYRCTTCGFELPSGIVGITKHWAECTGKDFTEGIMKLAAKTNGKLNESDVEQLRKQTLK